MSGYNVEIGGFIMAPDVIAQAYSIVTACVYGKIWRYEQLEDGVCRASQLRLSDELNITPKTLRTHIAQLVDGGWIRDITPGLRNRPHIYRTTGKLKLNISLAENLLPERNFYLPQRGIFTDESDTRGGSDSLPENTNSSPKNLFQLFEQEIGLLTPLIADELKEAAESYPADWFAPAFKEAAASGVRKWRYVRSVLERWKVDGFKSDKRQPHTKQAATLAWEC